MKTIESQSADCVVTSPPYFKLRDYGVEGEIGSEESPQQYVDNLVAIFREVKRVLKDEGTCWLNLGDCYADKDLLGIPWKVAFALQDDGWIVRQSIVWSKPNPMPEPVTDRCTRSHEMMFMLCKQKSYYYNHDAIREPIGESMKRSIRNGPRITEGYKHDEESRMGKSSGNHAFSRQASLDNISKGRNKHDVWRVSGKPYAGAHCAVFPPDLIEPCILAGCPKGGVVLDPFGGSGTTAGVAIRHGRKAILCELNPDFTSVIEGRIGQILGMKNVENKQAFNEWFGDDRG